MKAEMYDNYSSLAAGRKVVEIEEHFVLRVTTDSGDVLELSPSESGIDVRNIGRRAAQGLAIFPRSGNVVSVQVVS